VRPATNTVILGFTLNITSADPEALFRFYRDVIGVPPDEAFNAQFGGGALKIGDLTIVIDEHSATPARAQDPTRFLLDFTVSDIESETKRLESLGVVCIRQPSPEFWGGLVATFLDPDGNFVQLFQLPA
jgi:predicted enzyme related to lactoylglutathione lyase